MSEQLITQLAAAVAEEVPMAELVAGGVTQKTLSYRVNTFQRQKLVYRSFQWELSKRIP